MLYKKSQQERVTLRLRRLMDVLCNSIPENKGDNRTQVDELALDRRGYSSLTETREK